ncbi:50S ribosomal protein L30 [Candidatus Woesearchaeota archaeon]|mgnify:CR=1 FL=1|jgi:ribosomal protein L30E|nr:50S ribosomal protein L30 [Candidatus Woesearchaeota archaeon]MBT6519369.1 50S ribosomal protein L30 [Candidatus Woesearchaeota archaeon]MBT7367787.1 50S ribosomal protein L30 [Candidatus Woesearchaeota archaeon]
MSDAITEIKKLLKEEKLVFGADRTLKGLRTGGIAKVFLAANCDIDTLADFKHCCKLGNVECIELEYTNEELGDICKRPHNIKVLGMSK